MKEVIIPLATIVVGGLVAWITSKQSARATVQSSEVVSRTDIEKEAFERAKSYYGDAMDRQNAEIKRQDAEITELHDKVDHLEGDNDRLKHELALCKDDVRRLSAIIAARGED